MKPITHAQFKKMNLRQKSWLVLQSLGEKPIAVYVFYNPDGTRVPHCGTPTSRSYAEQCLNLLTKLKGCHFQRKLAFAMYAEFGYVAWRLFEEHKMDRFEVVKLEDGRWFCCLENEIWEDNTCAEAICGAWLITQKLMPEWPF
jgi:hypothetical protein